jgi:peroxiredoxin
MDQGPVLLDSVKLSGTSGMFSLKGRGKTQNIYELIFGDNIIAVPLINDAEDIQVDIDFAKQDDFYNITGSDASNRLKEFVSNLAKKNFIVEKDFAHLDSLKKSNASDSLKIVATNTKNTALNELNSYLRNFISNNKYPSITVLALNWASRSLVPAEFESILNQSVTKFPGYIALQNMQKNYQLQKAQEEEMQKKESESSWVSKQLPDLTLPDVNGKPVSLSSFRGKYVLVDFWASWCAPCRAENPNVVKAFNQFRNKNFTVVGVSLDRTKDDWQNAIKEDHLEWTHISDLKYWSSKAVELFKFDGIPFNVLVDPSGKVIAERLRGAVLEAKLQELLK